MKIKYLKNLSIFVGFIISFGLMMLEQTEVLENGRPITIFISVISYSLLGSIILFIAYKFIDWLIPVDIEAEIFKKNNLAVGVFKGLFLLSIAIIIGMVILSP